MRIESDGAKKTVRKAVKKAVVRDLALPRPPIKMLGGPAGSFRNDLGGARLSQAYGRRCWVKFLCFRVAVLRFRIAG